MKPKTVQKIVELLDNLPERKARNVMEYIQFLHWSDDDFSKEEIDLIQQARKEAKKNKGTPWRDVRNDV